MAFGYKSELDNYVISSIILGQLSKNFQYQNVKLITGRELLLFAYRTIVEACDNQYIRDLYINNGFGQILMRKKMLKNPLYVTQNGYHLFLQKLDNLIV